MAANYPKLVLASSSPRRREILSAAGIEFDVLPTDIAEVKSPQESIEEFVRRLAIEKAQAAFDAISAPGGSNALRGLPILGADTVVAIDGLALGKPANEAEAIQMVRRLAGRVHEVLTGVAILFASSNTGVHKEIGVSRTKVEFRKLTDEQIVAYVRSGEPYDKAGAYGIQGLASKFVAMIEGCYFNVVGLPIALVCEMLEKNQEYWPSGDTRTAHDSGGAN